MPQALSGQFDTVFSRSHLVAAGFGLQRGDTTAQIFVAGTTARNSTLPVQPDAQWHIGSITKTFTAVLIMMAVEDGLLALDTPLAALLPDHAQQMTADWQGLTLFEILSHTGGIPANPATAQMRMLAAGDLDRAGLLQMFWSQPLSSKRGRFAYSNLGYILAAETLESRVGTPWENQLRARIIAPLGLTSFGIGPPDVIYGHRSILGMFKRPVPPDAPCSDNPQAFAPAGRMHLSIADVLTWGRFLLSAQQGKSDLLSAQSLALMTRDIDKNYGLGLMTFSIPGVTGTAFGHDGSNSMWYALLAILPAKGAVACVVANEARPARVSRLGIKMLSAAMS